MESLVKIRMNLKFWSDKKVLITGNTGFKGSWLHLMLKLYGSNVCGIGLKPNKYSLFNLLELNNKKTSFTDINSYRDLKKKIKSFKPDIVFHLAAQPLVRRSYDRPLETYSTNVIGTLNLLNILREINETKSILNVTSDKVYFNNEKNVFYSEIDEIGGNDPYSSSKACSEIVSKIFYDCYFKSQNKGLATLRSGNIIGGGDFSNDRLIPDLMNSYFKNKKLIIRNPKSIRPWQYILDSIHGYIVLAEFLHSNYEKYSQAWNFGPNNNKKNWNVEKIVNYSKNYFSKDLNVTFKKDNQRKESKTLNLDSSKSNKLLKWKSKFDIKKSLDKTFSWYSTLYKNPSSIKKYTIEQIYEYLN